MNNQYTGGFATQQPGLQSQAAQMAPQNSSYGQQLGAALARPAQQTSSIPDLSSFMQMMERLKGLQKSAIPGAQQPPAPVFDHSFPPAG